MNEFNNLKFLIDSKQIGNFLVLISIVGALIFLTGSDTEIEIMLDNKLNYYNIMYIGVIIIIFLIMIINYRLII
jgi:hypothetical protein